MYHNQDYFILTPNIHYSKVLFDNLGYRVGIH